MITLRPWKGTKNTYEADITLTAPDGRKVRQRVKAPVTGKSAAERWARAREQELLAELRRDDPSCMLLTRSNRLRLSCALGVTALHHPGVPREELEAVFAELRRVADDLSEEPDEAELLALAGDLVSEFWNRLR